MPLHVLCVMRWIGFQFWNLKLSKHLATTEATVSRLAQLALLQQIEAEFGRERSSRWAPRTLDIDLIAFGDQIAPDEPTLQYWMELPFEKQKALTPEQLILPHPRMQQRAFVLIPLSEIAPGWRHPMTGSTVLEMVQSLPEQDKKGVQLFPTP